MSILAVKSIPLSRETRDAWKSNGITFLRRSRNGRVPPQIAQRYDTILNLGNTNLSVDGDTVIYNAPDTIRAVSTAPALRRTLGDVGNFLPSFELDGPHWHKRNGFGGEGKVFHEDIIPTLCPRMPGDVQQHVDGVEYRVITVGEKVDQAFRKDKDDGVHNRYHAWDWTWVGVDGIRRNGIIPLLKEGINHVPENTRSVFGWDIIHNGERPWIIECNTSPGVNEHTARRIVDAIT